MNAKIRTQEKRNDFEKRGCWLKRHDVAYQYGIRQIDEEIKGRNINDDEIVSMVNRSQEEEIEDTF